MPSCEVDHVARSPGEKLLEHVPLGQTVLRDRIGMTESSSPLYYWLESFHHEKSHDILDAQ